MRGDTQPSPTVAQFSVWLYYRQHVPFGKSISKVKQYFWLTSIFWSMLKLIFKGFMNTSDKTETCNHIKIWIAPKVKRHVSVLVCFTCIISSVSNTSSDQNNWVGCQWLPKQHQHFQNNMTVACRLVGLRQQNYLVRFRKTLWFGLKRFCDFGCKHVMSLH